MNTESISLLKPNNKSMHNKKI